MVSQALAGRRPLLIASLLASIAYAVLDNAPIGEIWIMAIKGAAVGSLAIYALLRHVSLDAKWLAAILAISAIADMIVEIDLRTGGSVFAVANILAIGFYLRHRRHNPKHSQTAAALALVAIGGLYAWLATEDWSVVLYGLLIGGLAGSAWASRFSRYRVGLGAVMFLFSDLLIFTRMGLAPGSAFIDALVWPFYYLGQFLIATGVIQTLRGDLKPQA